MANTLGNGVCDIVADAGTDTTVTTSNVKIRSMVWDAPTAADDLKITDGNGKVIFEAVAAAGGAGATQELPMGYPIWVNGLIVETNDGGTLYIYYDQGC